MVSTHARASSGTVVWKGTDSWPCQLTRSCGALDPTRPRQQAQVVQGNDGGDRNADSAEWVTRFNWSPGVRPPDLQAGDDLWLALVNTATECSQSGGHTGYYLLGRLLGSWTQ
ncbi:hypothetical protein DUI87_24309 [Hirundo rustica rustica]|uniref:Uncharacterized protein n=1 Tax=Hirundo rustica rustica TaxID=333673 RepID=A0A3M0JFN5_HIRRU|nr:hypothetical protein DUI87_24309 [Hirundo rustica rustica]